MLAKMLEYIAARLKEPSTYPGMVLVLSSAGLAISPEMKDAIIIGGLAIAGLIGAAMPDRVGKNTRDNDPPTTKE